MSGASASQRLRRLFSGSAAIPTAIRWYHRAATGGVREAPEQEPVQQEPKNKNQQQQPLAASPVVENAHASKNGTSPDVEQLAKRLLAAGYTPLSAARDAAVQSPELSAAWLTDLQNKIGLKNPGGYLRKRIASGEFPETAEPEIAARPKRSTLEQITARLDAAFAAAPADVQAKIRLQADLMQGEGKASEAECLREATAWALRISK